MRRHDVIVVGAGTNGLTAAALLARAGRDVLVLERAERVGGLAAGEMFHPGYHTTGVLHDTTGVRRRIADELELENHGVRFASAPSTVLALGDHGLAITLSDDPDRCVGLGVESAPDVERYTAYQSFLGDIRPIVRDLLDAPPPRLVAPRGRDVASLVRHAARLRRLGRERMTEVLRVAPMGLADWLDEWFASDLLKAALAGPALQATSCGPYAPGGVANLLALASSADRAVIGGPSALVDGLVRAAESAGVTIRTEARVRRVHVSDDRVHGVEMDDGAGFEAPIVAASCDPRHVLLELLPSRLLPYRTRHHMLHFRGQGTTAVVRLALSSPPVFTRGQDRPVLEARIAGSLQSLERAFDAIKYGALPERPLLDVRVPTVERADLAPEGHAVATVLVHAVPYALDCGWSNGERERLADRVVEMLAEHAPDLPRTVVAREILTPIDIERRYGAVRGHLHHGEHTLDQRVVRPIPECVGYRTPIDGLFLCGSGSHPGGGVTCVPGALAARAISG